MAQQSLKRPRLEPADRILWAWLSRVWSGWERVLQIVQPLRDRDGTYGAEFRRRVRNMGVEEVVIAPRSPWQSPYVERLIGSIHQECLDHVVVFNERHLRRILSGYFAYYHSSRVHQSLDMDCPKHRPVEPPAMGEVVELPRVAGLHHRYERRAA